MKAKPSKRIEKFRVKEGHYASDASYGNNGMFLIPGPEDATLRVVVSDGLSWDHVSVSRADKTPSWAEMCFVKDIFFRSDETVIQYHPAKEDYVNNMAFCLHMWKPQIATIPKPLSLMAGFK